MYRLILQTSYHLKLSFSSFRIFVIIGAIIVELALAIKKNKTRFFSPLVCYFVMNRGEFLNSFKNLFSKNMQLNWMTVKEVKFFLAL